MMHRQITILVLLACLGVLPCLADPNETRRGAEMLPSIDDVNRSFGLPLWDGSNLWESSDAAAATRLGARVESQTPKECTYSAKPPLVFGVKPEVLKLSGKDGKVDSLLIMYANKGDTLGLRPGVERPVEGRDLRAATRDFGKRDASLEKTIRAQADRIEDALVRLFGKFDRTRFGQGYRLAEHVKAWRWKGHVFLLSEQRDTGLSLRIVPLDSIENRTGSARVKSADLKAELLKHVEERANGDVVITGIPMIDQGEKGYCVPATWARYMRYLGIDVDEYVLANAAGTERGGGTSVEAMVGAAGTIARKNQRAIREISGPIKMSDIARSIKIGLPLMWSMHAVGPFNETGRSAGRMGALSAAEWKESPELKEARRKAPLLAGDTENRHMCMIVGYNLISGEIATSDSWGPAHAEKWYTLAEVMAVSADKLYYIKW